MRVLVICTCGDLARWNWSAVFLSNNGGATLKEIESWSGNRKVEVEVEVYVEFGHRRATLRYLARFLARVIEQPQDATFEGFDRAWNITLRGNPSSQ